MDESKLVEQSNNAVTRRDLLAGAVATAGACVTAGALAPDAMSQAAAGNGLIRTAEAIHQEITFDGAEPKRVYDALTIAAQFQKVEMLSDASKNMNLAAKPAEISTEPGGAFSLFGGYITGRQIELVANQRIVLVWRVGSWAPGAYSLARFELAAHGAGTLLTFDHTGIPAGTGEHLAEGWAANYWSPLKKFLV